MSLLTDFKSDCPLTPKKLEEWLSNIVAKIIKADTFTFDGIAISQIIAKENNSSIDDICSAADFESMYNAIKNGNTLKLVIDNTVYTIPVANVLDVESDNYKYICFHIFGTFKSLTGTSTMKHLTVGIESIEGSLRICDKSIAII